MLALTRITSNTSKSVNDRKFNSSHFEREMCLIFLAAVTCSSRHDDLADIDVSNIGNDDLHEMLEHFTNGEKQRWGRISHLLRKIDAAKDSFRYRTHSEEVARSISARKASLRHARHFARSARELRGALELFTENALGTEKLNDARKLRLSDRVERSDRFRDFARAAKAKDSNVTDSTIKTVYFARLSIEALEDSRFRRAKLYASLAQDASGGQDVAATAVSAAQSAVIAAQKQTNTTAIADNIRTLWSSFVK